MCEANIDSEIYIANNDDVKKKWKTFVDEFEKNRYTIPNTHELITVYVNTLIKDNPLLIQPNEVFFRARINETNPYKEFNHKELGAPPKGKASFGRLNPKGISYLYIAYEEATAISEIKPYVSAKIDIAKCKINNTLKILDLTSSNYEEREQNFRKMLSVLFSQPVTPGTAEKEYMPTQYIAEYFKKNKFDGVKYQSSKDSTKSNICLFKFDDVKITYDSTVEVKRVEVSY